MLLTKTFMSGRSQAIRLPKEYRLPDEDIYLNMIDGVLMAIPKSRLWDVVEASLSKFTEDFMLDRGKDVPDLRVGE